MPCLKCSNGKWRYGEHGKCVFDTYEQCRAAEIAIIIGDKKEQFPSLEDCGCYDIKDNTMSEKQKPNKKPKPGRGKC